MAAERFAEAVASAERGIHFAAGFLGCSEASIRQDGFHVFAGLAGDGDFKIVNRGCAVQGEGAGVAALHQVDQNWRQAALDDVAAEAPQDHPLSGASGGESLYHGAKGIAGQNMRERIDPGRDSTAGINAREILGAHLAAAFVYRNGTKPAQIERLATILAHATFPFRSVFSSACAV